MKGITVDVALMGGLSVSINKVRVLDSSAKINKPWQVFCYLVLNRGGMPSSPAQLIDALWPDEMLTDPGNVLKNTVYALRREFKKASAVDINPILFDNGGYFCNPGIRYVVDAEQFDKFFTKAQTAKEEGKIKLLTDAVHMYKGELLPKLGSESWVMTRSLYYKKRFEECVEQLCSLLYQNEKYNELLEIATSASQIDPLEERYFLYIFKALYALHMYNIIIPTYHKTARIFSEALGVGLSQEIKDIYASASEQVDSIEQDIMIIKADLKETAKDVHPVRGPLYCTYDVFKYLYQMVARSSERVQEARLLFYL